MNTGDWMFGWIARACWDGAGPYYATTIPTGKPTTRTFTMPVNGSRTVNIYYKPNGEEYAYVYKGSTPWEYFYPSTNNNLPENPSNDVPDTDGSTMRANRYRDVLRSDHYIVKNGQPHGNVCVGIDTGCGCVGVALSPCNDEGYLIPPMNPGGSSYAEATSGANKFRLVPRHPGSARPISRPGKRCRNGRTQTLRTPVATPGTAL